MARAWPTWLIDPGTAIQGTRLRFMKKRVKGDGQFFLPDPKENVTRLLLSHASEASNSDVPERLLKAARRLQAALDARIARSADGKMSGKENSEEEE